MASKQDDLVDDLSKLSIKPEHETKTNVEIQPTWLVTYPNKLGYSFQCSLTLKQLIDQNLSQKYFQKLLYITEQENQIYDFHMQLNSSSHGSFKVDIRYKDVDKRRGPTKADVCMSCDISNALSQISLIKQTSTIRIWLDAQLRNKLIITPRRHIERLSEMIDEEMIQFWYHAQVILDEEGCNWSSIIINHGKYQTHHHLHMKINISEEQWNQCIKVKYAEKIEQMQQLFRSDSNIVQNVFW